MALQGFRCPSCHTWFEDEGYHPRCPACGARASPDDTLGGQQQVQTMDGGQALEAPAPVDDTTSRRRNWMPLIWTAIWIGIILLQVARRLFD